MSARPRTLITAGATREPIDQVRYISNRSSGRLGYELARAAHQAGHDVVLISGPVALPPPRGVELVSIETAAELHRATLAHFADASIAIMAAAVADYTPAKVARGKLARSGRGLTLTLRATTDTCAACGRRKRPDQFLVGFALEADDPDHVRALGKLRRKRCDLIVANPLATQGAPDATLTVLGRDGPITTLNGTKAKVARQLIALITSRRAARPPGRQ